jgi:hypothetical protein
LGPLPFHPLVLARQGDRPAPRTRRCLLKGCERWFVPPRPQARYCGNDCRLAAQRWRRVQASRRYRANPAGRARRCQQNRSYRQRRRARTAALRHPPCPCEGKRPVAAPENFAQKMCARPGCYVVFHVAPEHSCRRFCSLACRLALRRVLEREARYRQRRRRWRRQRLSRRPKPPDTS